MKKGIKIVIAFILVIALVIEGFVLLKKDKEDNSEEQNKDKRIVATAGTTYKANGLKFKYKGEDHLHYLVISGLKNEKVEDKINKMIKERAEYVKDNYKAEYYDDTVVVVRGSYANILSLEIGIDSFYDSYEEDIGKVNLYQVCETLNFDLNTGNLLTIDDVLLSIEGFRDVLLSEVYYYANHAQGFINGMRPNDHPHYERVDDGVMSVMNKFNSKNFSFSISPSAMSFYFKDVYINVPKEEFFSKSETDKEKIDFYKDLCKVSYEDKDYIDFICEDEYETTYHIDLPFYYVANDLVIYDTYLSKESLFEKDGDELLKYVSNKEDNNYIPRIVYEENNNLYYFSGLHENSFDFGEENWTCDIKFDDIKKRILEDYKDEIKGEYKAINFYIDTNYLSLGCSVGVYSSTYQLDKDSYNEYKNRILTKWTAKDYFLFSSSNNAMYGYEFLESYNPTHKFMTYAYDRKAREIAVKELINPKINLKDYIPNSWLKLGKYKTKDELMDSLYIAFDKNILYKDRMGILIVYNYWGYGYKLIYEGKEFEFEYDEESDFGTIPLLEGFGN